MFQVEGDEGMEGELEEERERQDSADGSQVSYHGNNLKDSHKQIISFPSIARIWEYC